MDDPVYHEQIKPEVSLSTIVTAQNYNIMVTLLQGHNNLS